MVNQIEDDTCKADRLPNNNPYFPINKIHTLKYDWLGMEILEDKHN